MFGYLKRGYVIEKAYDLWRREAGIDFKSEISKLPLSRQAEYRNMLREPQKDMGATEHEVAVLMTLPFLQYLDLNARDIVIELVAAWSSSGKVRMTVQTQFRQMLAATS